MKLAKLSMPRRRVTRIGDVLGLGDRIADAHPRRVDTERELVAEEIVRDPHLVAVGIRAERQQRRVLRLPAEAADAPVAGAAILDDAGAAADAVAVAVVWIRKSQDRLVGNGFDEPSAEHRDRNPPRR